MHINLAFIHDLCYVSYYFEVIKGFKRSKKVIKGHFFIIWKWLKKWSIYFFKGKISTTKTFFIKKTKHVEIFFHYKENIFKNRKLPHNEKIGQLGQFCWQIWVSCQISNMKLLLNCNFVKFWKNIYLATKWSWYLGLYHIYRVDRK